MSRQGNEIARALCAEIEKGGLPIDTTDWQQVRIQAAIAAMQGFIGVPQMPFGHIAGESVRIADALVAELQKKGGQDE